MRKCPDMPPNEEYVHKHVFLSKRTYAALKKEANDFTGGNFSMLLRKILRERYKINEARQSDYDYQ